MWVHQKTYSCSKINCTKIFMLACNYLNMQFSAYIYTQDTIRVAIEGVTMLRTWCFKKSHIKLIFTCFFAYAGVVWRSVNKNYCSRESIFSERRSYMVIFIPFFIITAFHLKFTHCSTSCHMKDCVFIIEWFQWQRQWSWSQRLAIWFVQILKELTKSCVFKKNGHSLWKTRNMDFSLDRSQYFLYFLIHVHLLCFYNEFKTENPEKVPFMLYNYLKLKILAVKRWLHCVRKIR